MEEYERKLMQKKKARKVRKIESQMELNESDRFAETQAEYVDEFPAPSTNASANSITLTMNELAINMGLGRPSPTPPPPPKPRASVRYKRDNWYEHVLDEESQIARSCRTAIESSRNIIESHTDVRCLEIGLSDLTLRYQPVPAQEWCNFVMPGVTAQLRVTVLTVILGCATIISTAPLSNDVCKYTIGGGWILWILEGWPESNSKIVWMLIPRVTFITLAIVVPLLARTEIGKRLIAPVAYALALFLQAEVLALAILFPCGGIACPMMGFVSYISAVLALQWDFILFLQLATIVVLATFLAVPSWQPSNVCPAITYTSDGGVSGDKLSLLGSDVQQSEYWKVLCFAFLNFPLVYFFRRAVALKIMYQLRDALMWEQYDTSMKSEFQQAEVELKRAKTSLAGANKALEKMQRQTEKNRIGLVGQTVSLLDICREPDGFVSFALVRNHLKLMPDWHRTKVTAIITTWNCRLKMAKDEDSDDNILHSLVHNSAFLYKLFAHMTEANVGVTLQQTLLEIANVY